ncbi:MAG: hypothetical protein J7L20_04860 [Thermoplasmata archaeon]|nr:hypothetical protein [Thermoplasmata archaeon]
MGELCFAAGDKRETLYVGKNDTSASIDAYVVFHIKVNKLAIPTVLWWILGVPSAHAGGAGASIFIPNYWKKKPYEVNVTVEGDLIYSVFL